MSSPPHDVAVSMNTKSWIIFRQSDTEPHNGRSENASLKFDSFGKPSMRLWIVAHNVNFATVPKISRKRKIRAAPRDGKLSVDTIAKR